MNFTSRCYFYVPLLHLVLGSWRDVEKGHECWPVGFTLFGFHCITRNGIDVRSLFSSSVVLCCDGGNFYHLGQ